MKADRCLSLILIFLISLSIILLTTCATVSNPQEAEDILYENDFSSEDGMFAYHRPVMEVNNGSLYLSGSDPGGHLKIPYGRNTETTFRIKLEDPDGGARIFVIWSHEIGSSVSYLLSPRLNNIQHHVTVDNPEESVFDNEAPFQVETNSWYDIAITIESGRSVFSIDGTVLFSTFLPPELPESGSFFLLCEDGEFRIDDLKIISLSAALPEAKRADGELIYESSFDHDDGMMEIHRGMAVEDGVLKFVDDNPGCNFREPYGQDSITEFRLKLPEADSSAHISFLWRPEEGMRLVYFFEKSHIGLQMMVADERVYDKETEYYLKTGAWSDIRVEIISGISSLFINQKLVMESPVAPGLPSEGYFFPLAYESQMQMDDLAIYRLPKEDSAVTERVSVSEPEAVPTIGSLDLGERRIAVVGIKAEDPEISDALASFVTNALVNMNIGRIMERSDVQQIISEYEFQAAAITDESTAVEIGKLLGADVITVGSLYQVGTIDYLNIKMIDVKTGEIIASSMSSSTVEEEYLRMCNEAVEQIKR